MGTGAEKSDEARAGRCVYTTLIGRYESLNEQPTAASSSLPHICLTDDPDLESETWQIRLVEPTFSMDPIRSQRDFKIRAHRHLREFGRSLYIDNSVVLRAPAEDVLELVPDETPIGLVNHSFRDTVLEEFFEVAKLGLDDSGRVFEQLNHYQLVAPDLLRCRPIWTGLMVRSHADEAVSRMEEAWYAQVLRYSRRDQLSVWLALKSADLTPHLLSLENHASDYHEWPRARDRDVSAVRQPLVSSAPPAARVRYVERALAQQVKRADERERALAAESTRAEALTSALADRDSSVQTLTGREMELTARIEKLTARIGELRSEQGTLLASTSWRWTAPARRLGRWLRRKQARMTRSVAALRPISGEEGLARQAWYLYFRCRYHLRRRTHGPRELLVGPDEAGRPFLLWKVAHLLGVTLVRSTHDEPRLGYRHDKRTFPADGAPQAAMVLNGRCTDVSKRRVDRAMREAFGYGLGVDPVLHTGPMVVKSDANATHDGVVVEGPITSPDPLKVYQRVVDNLVAPAVVEDLRATVVAGTVVLVFRKQRPASERFLNTVTSARLDTPEAVFTSAECSSISRLANDMGLDMGEIDVLRDRHDGRVYVVDVNNTPFSPPRAAYTLSGIRAMHRVADAFQSAWGTLLDLDD